MPSKQQRKNVHPSPSLKPIKDSIVEDTAHDQVDTQEVDGQSTSTNKKIIVDN